MNGDDEDQSARIFVGNLNEGVFDQIELKNHFAKYGNITKTSLLKGFGFIQFEEKSAAEAAIAGEDQNMFCGNKLRVKNAFRSSEVGQADRGGRGNPRGGGRGRGRGGGGGDDDSDGFHGGFRGRGGRGGGRGRGRDRDDRYYDDYEGGRDREFRGRRRDDDRPPFGRGGRDDRDDGYAQPPQWRGDRGGDPDGFRGEERGGFPGSRDQPRPQEPPAEKANDCEIVCVNKTQRGYAESIEMRLKNFGMDVDVLFPNPEIPLQKIIGNISSRGVSYALVVTPMNEEHRSVTLNVLRGPQQQEHRNMPIDDAMNLLAKNFEATIELRAKTGGDRMPNDVRTVLGFLVDSRPLSVMEYDKLIRYLAGKREQMLRSEYGEDIPAHLVEPPIGKAVDPAVKARQSELQAKILGILKKPLVAPPPAPMPVAQAAAAATAPVITPSLQKAIDSLIKTGPNLLNAATQPPPPPPQSTLSTGSYGSGSGAQHQQMYGGGANPTGPAPQSAVFPSYGGGY